MRQGVRVKDDVECAICKPRYSRYIEWACPGCGETVRVRGALEILHQCAKRNNRVTSFKRVGAKAVAS